MIFFRKFRNWLKARRLTVDNRGRLVEVTSEPILKEPTMMSIPVLSVVVLGVLQHEVVMTGLIHTESGGDPNAHGDNGRSLGICQIGRAAWEDTVAWNKTLRRWGYDKHWRDPVINTIVADNYVNKVIPAKYFHRWGIPDSVPMRIAAYKMGPGRLMQIWREHKDDWMNHVPKTVIRDLKKYDVFVQKQLEHSVTRK